MKKTRLCLDLIQNVETSIEDQIPMIKDCGFDEFFTCFWTEERMKNLARLAKEHGLGFQSVHAPFSDVVDLWRESEKAEPFVELLLRSVESTATIDVPILVMHVFKGYVYPDKPNGLGVERFYKVVKRAEKLGVHIAFENLEGEEFLACLMENFKSEKNVGFCWDSGHELCYNGGKDMLAKYGDKLLCTHLNDNFGVSDPHGRIGKHDDLHLFPFDGKTDWDDAVKRLKKTAFNGSLTFELKKPSYPDLPIEAFLKTAYERAEKIKSLYERA